MRTEAEETAYQAETDRQLHEGDTPEVHAKSPRVTIGGDADAGYVVEIHDGERHCVYSHDDADNPVSAAHAAYDAHMNEHGLEDDHAEALEAACKAAAEAHPHTIAARGVEDEDDGEDLTIAPAAAEDPKPAPPPTTEPPAAA